MTLSADARKQAIRDALTLMLAAVGDRAFDEAFCDVRRHDVSVAPFDGLSWTTWEDLEARSYVRPAHSIGLRTFRLTGAGWIAALKVARQYDTPAQKNRILTLRQALIDANKGRPALGTLVSIPEIVEWTGLPRGWVTSAVLSQLLASWFKDDRMRLEIGRDIRIPSRFAADRIEFDPDEYR
jgi:hypothetical protein